MALPPLLLPAPLTPSDVEAVARHGRQVELSPLGRDRVTRVRSALERRLGGTEALYGVNTGFGSLARVRIDREQLGDVQRNLIRSHASGVGEPLPEDVVRAMMLLLAASLARGCSGVRAEVIDRILAFLNHGITPLVPSRGSVGASGDLAPLAHIALALIGEGRAGHRGLPAGVVEPTGRSMVIHRIAPLRLEAKEGLALINGTHLMAAIGALGLCDVDRLIDASIGATAMSIDACRATDSFLDSRLHEARRQRGQIQVAERLRGLLAGSAIVASHKVDDPRVQDPYCLRAAPQVLGAAIDAMEFVRATMLRELDAVTDNPLVFTHGSDSDLRCDVLSGGNFHGMPVAIALDTAKIALATLAGISERRVNWLLSATDPQNPVRPYLSPEPGLHSGYMIAQYAAAACCNELQVLAHPACVHNVTTSAGIEDYNSFGPTSGHHLRRGIELATTVVAIELLVMAEALECQRPLRSGEGVERLFATVREQVPRLVADRPPSPDIATLEAMIRAARFALVA